MKHVGIFDAKTHLSSLIDEVEKGREVVITRHGKPVARLVPRRGAAQLPKPWPSAQQGSERACARSGNGSTSMPTHEQIKAWIEEGRH